MADKKTIGITIIIVAIAIVWAISSGTLFGGFAILPSGQYTSNSACTFQTNADFGANGEQVTDYANSGIWISVDADNNGVKEGYGFYGSTSTSNDVCSSKTQITTTPGGLRVVLYNPTSNEVGICSPDGRTVERFRTTTSSGIAQQAILTCNTDTTCTPDWQTTQWSSCSDGIQIRTVSDANNCGVTTDKPATMQSCTSSTNPACPSFNDLINYAQQWQSCSA